MFKQQFTMSSQKQYPCHFESCGKTCAQTYTSLSARYKHTKSMHPGYHQPSKGQKQPYYGHRSFPPSINHQFKGFLYDTDYTLSTFGSSLHLEQHGNKQSFFSVAFRILPRFVEHLQYIIGDTAALERFEDQCIIMFVSFFVFSFACICICICTPILFLECSTAMMIKLH